jgi:hypothetical protein
MWKTNGFPKKWWVFHIYLILQEGSLEAAVSLEVALEIFMYLYLI